MSEKPRNPYLKPGTLVRRQNTVCEWDTEACYDPGEVGRVVHCWDNDGIWDCYIAFFGETAPGKNEKPDKPYVLRYWTGGLEVLEEKE
tara:strand:+ start:1623 stop:1886 length:264 start_codon:yes stop_codon:yes gene_type:complete